MWIAKHHYEFLTGYIADLRSGQENIAREKDKVIAHQESRLAVLEQERRELVDKLLTREEDRLKPPAAIPTTQDDDWQSIMRQQIEELEQNQEKPNG